jgi:hypothetical protein
MHKFLRFLTLLLYSISGFSQTAESKMVPFTIGYTPSNPPQVQLRWNKITGTTNTAVWRKQFTESGWTVIATGIGINDTAFADTAFKVGVAYEYQVVKTVSGSTISGVQAAGKEIAPPRQRMECLIVADSSLYRRLTKEIDSFITLIELDGWKVKRITTAPTETSIMVKNKIMGWNDALSGSAEKSIVLIGKVPIPYSGNLAPDAHPEHVGAWPADCYYGELINTAWNDVSVTTSGATLRAENKNMPGDGKFDESTIPDLIEGQVGRIYLDSLPVMGVSADSLYKRYFNKIFRYKNKDIVIPRTACIEDRLGALGTEWPGRNVFQNAYSLVGKDSTIWAPNTFLSKLKSTPFLFAQVTSTGGYTQVVNVASSLQVKDSMNAVFQGYFGSYFGDWDNTNNFLRSAIAGNGLNLTAVWGGRPQWLFHHMALGKSVGYSAKITQNNVSTYYAGAFANGVHIGLMGDPTLKLHVVAPSKNIRINAISDKTAVKVDWDPVAENVSSYYIFRSDSLRGWYALYDSVDATKTTYTDTKPKVGKSAYMVRAAKLENTPNGSYYNLGLGSRATIDSVVMKVNPSAVFYMSMPQLTITPIGPLLRFACDQSNLPITTLVMNSVGQIMREITWQNGGAVDMSEYISGTYLLQFYARGNFVESKKYIKH